MYEETEVAELDEQAWAEALELYRSWAMIVKVAARRHEDWVLDLPVLMRCDTPDSRGWRTKDSFELEFERDDDPFFPFDYVPGDESKPDHWKAGLREIHRSSARRYLVTLSTGWINVNREPDFEARRAGLEEKADVILSRFPEGARFYANSGSSTEGFDYYAGTPGWSSFSRHDWDHGLILVSETEVGMVWAFRF